MSIYSDKDHPMEDYYVNMSEWLQKPGVVGQLGHDHLNSSYRKAAVRSVALIRHVTIVLFRQCS